VGDGVGVTMTAVWVGGMGDGAGVRRTLRVGPGVSQAQRARANRGTRAMNKVFLPGQLCGCSIEVIATVRSRE